MSWPIHWTYTRHEFSQGCENKKVIVNVFKILLLITISLLKARLKTQMSYN